MSGDVKAIGVLVGDIELYCEAQGTGAPLVLIIGMAANSAMWHLEFV